MYRGFLRLCLGAVLACGYGPAVAGIESTYADHTRAIERARAGHYDEGLAILNGLLARFPDDYPLNRDAILIHTWKGDCNAALSLFPRVQSHPRLDDYLIAPLADCAVQRARQDDYDAALGVLTALLPHAVDTYPLERDIAVITMWKGDCAGALEWLNPIRTDPRNEPYLIVPAVDCLLQENRTFEAAALAEAALERFPNDPDLAHALEKTEVAIRLDENLDESRPEAIASLASDESQRGPREWIARLEASAALRARLRLYGRYLATRSSDPDASAGDLNRVGVGLRWRPWVRWWLAQEFSTDVSESGKGGSHTFLVYRPYDTLRFTVEHHTFAEDISLNARAAGIEANRTEASVEYNSIDYVWYARGSLAAYDYSDGNERRSAYATLGYAYERLPEREQRLYVEAYTSQNSLGDQTVYFNPTEDASLGLVHRTDFVFDSRFKRHVDRLFFIVGPYWQEGFDTETKWGVRYEQDYDLDGANALWLAAAFDRNVYDGKRESEFRVEISFRRRL